MLSGELRVPADRRNQDWWDNYFLDVAESVANASS